MHTTHWWCFVRAGLRAVEQALLGAITSTAERNGNFPHQCQIPSLFRVHWAAKSELFTFRMPCRQIDNDPRELWRAPRTVVCW